MIALGQLVLIGVIINHLVDVHFVTSFQELCSVKWHSPEKAQLKSSIFK